MTAELKSSQGEQLLLTIRPTRFGLFKLGEDLLFSKMEAQQSAIAAQKKQLIEETEQKFQHFTQSITHELDELRVQCVAISNRELMSRSDGILLLINSLRHFSHYIGKYAELLNCSFSQHISNIDFNVMMIVKACEKIDFFELNFSARSFCDKMYIDVCDFHRDLKRVLERREMATDKDENLFIHYLLQVKAFVDHIPKMINALPEKSEPAMSCSPR